MHTAIITAEALSILYLLILFFSMLRGEKKHRTSFVFILCLAVAVIAVGMDLLSYVLEYTSAAPFWLHVVNMLSFFGYDFELISMAEKEMYADKEAYYERHGLSRRKT